MATTVSDCIDVRERARGLGLEEVADFSLLPLKLDSATSSRDLIHHQDALTIGKLLIESGVEIQQLRTPNDGKVGFQKSADWIGPTIFVGASLLSQNPMLIDVAMNVIGSYVSDMLMVQKSSGGRARLSVIVEQSRNRRFRKIDYEGPVSGLKDLPRAIREAANE